MASLPIEQVYTITNAIAKITLGEEAPTVVDSSGFVSLGTRLGLNNKKENFLSSLTAKIAKTIINGRRYKNKWQGLYYDDVEWAAYIQMIEVDMPDAMEDVSTDLVDGQSVDMYVIAKPKAREKFYYSRATETYMITIQKHWFTTAFTGPEGMAAFFQYVKQKLLNKMELGTENMGRLTALNWIGLQSGTPREIHLCAEYAAATGLGIPSAPLEEERFLRFMSKRFKDYADFLSTFSVEYNAEGIPDFTPDTDLRTIIPKTVMTSMESNVEWQAFHKDAVALGSNITIPYWLSKSAPLDFQIRVNKSMDDANPNPQVVTIEGLVGIMYDKLAMGCYRTTTEVSTTPYNSRGRYWNTFWHGDRFWFNNLGKNGLIFTLT